MEPTHGACFQYGAQACRLSFPSSYVPLGTPVGTLHWWHFPVSPGGFRVVRKGLVSSLFQLLLPLFSSLFRP